LNHRGLNAILFELPYHLRRRPKAPAAVRDFISDNLAGMLMATRQAIADIEAIALWRRAEGSNGVAVWGFSLGAWLAGLHLTQSTTPAAAVLTTPVSDMKLAIETLPFCFPVRAALELTVAPVERLNLTAHRPRIAAGKILMTEALYDEFVPSITLATLAREWKLPAWQKLPQSHISILLSRRSMGLAMDWLRENLG
jgi:alpha-beta hydrolase superfamily lysophospholipase